MAKGDKYAISEVGDVVTLTFNDAGKTKVALDTGKLTPALKIRGNRHGWKQRLIDVGAGKDLTTHLALAKRLVECAQRGMWESDGIDTDILADAIARVTGKTKADVEVILGKADTAKLKEYDQMPNVVSAKADILAERAKLAVNAEDPTKGLEAFK